MPNGRSLEANSLHRMPACKRCLKGGDCLLTAISKMYVCNTNEILPSLPKSVRDIEKSFEVGFFKDFDNGKSRRK